MVGVEGFEPPVTESKSGVLPLDDTPINFLSSKAKQRFYFIKQVALYKKYGKVKIYFTFFYYLIKLSYKL